MKHDGWETIEPALVTLPFWRTWAGVQDCTPERTMRRTWALLRMSLGHQVQFALRAEEDPDERR